MEQGLDELINFRKNALAFYSPYVFIREIKPFDQFDLFVKRRIEEFGTKDSCLQFAVTVDGANFVFLYEYLTWDSNHFERKCYKLFTVLYSQENAPALVKAARIFKDKLFQVEPCYCFSEIPAEDIFLIQALNEAGFKLVETRLHYFRKKLEDFTGEHYSVRSARAEEALVLSKVAAQSRNEYDRLHADYSFSDAEADHYLATYAAASVNGFCDCVIVPNVPNLPVASFLAYDVYEKISPNHYLSVMYARLAAVTSENRGWYVKLLTEFMQRAKEQKASYVKITTQSTNKTVIKTFEKLGCSLGAASHILTYNS
ncbi:hypothetical protein [Rufibacter roseolus]|uniref:hypothetical protein n=1 Tax=Rufibacter roseolus TaxID=2817375 RepID=UPI001B3023D9|nr:hypothetical protein [Rufibacter roseolus]